MNRVIEFRGLDKNGKWHFGDFICNEMGCNICYSIDTSPCMSDPGGDTRFERVSCDINTIGQFIGLKDIKNKKIFEGDLIRIIHEEGRLTWPNIYTDIGHVIFSDRGSFVVKVDKTQSKKEFYIAFSPQRTFEIIGNIHQPKQTI